MSFTIQGGNVLTQSTKLTTADPTEIASGGQSGAVIIGIYAAELAGSTPSLRIYKKRGTTETHLRGAKAMTAYEEYTRDVIIVLKANETLEAEASAANQVDIMVSYIPSDATAKGGAY